MHISLKRATLLTAVVLGTFSVSLRAEEAPRDPRALQNQTLAAMNDITTALDAKNTTLAWDLVGKLYNSTTPGTIDRAYADLVYAQILSGQDKYADAATHLEAALAPKLFNEADTERYTVGLAHMFVELKQVPKALAVLTDYVTSTPRPADDTLYMYAALLMECGKGPEALVQAQKLIERRIDPPQNYYQMAAACAQTVNNYDLACSYLERLIEMDPKNEMYWTQLVAMHSAAGELIPAIVSLERAQKRGLMTAQQFQIVRLELYYNMERWPQSAEILADGLDTGKLPNEQRYWEMLCMCYDRMFEPEKAMEVLKKASARTPWSAIDTRMAERNYRDGKFAEVIVNLQNALRKGGIERVGDLWCLMASSYLELKQIDKAEKALDEAAKSTDATTKTKVERLRRIIAQTRAIQAREAEAAAGAHQPKGK